LKKGVIYLLGAAAIDSIVGGLRLSKVELFGFDELQKTLA
jgi:hypothetical protein